MISGSPPFSRPAGLSAVSRVSGCSWAILRLNCSVFWPAETLLARLSVDDRRSSSIGPSRSLMTLEVGDQRCSRSFSSTARVGYREILWPRRSSNNGKFSFASSDSGSRLWMFSMFGGATRLTVDSLEVTASLLLGDS